MTHEQIRFDPSRMPTPPPPDSFFTALKGYAGSLTSIYEGLPLSAYQEEPLKRLVAGLLEKAASGVSVYFETAVPELSARPDRLAQIDARALELAKSRSSDEQPIVELAGSLRRWMIHGKFPVAPEEAEKLVVADDAMD